jgi:hypothetical protein
MRIVVLLILHELRVGSKAFSVQILASLVQVVVHGRLGVVLVLQVLLDVILLEVLHQFEE